MSVFSLNFYGIVLLPKMTFLNEIPACRTTVPAVTGRLAGWLAVAKACTINSTGSVKGHWLAACRAVTVTWQVCRYLIDLSGKQLVIHIHVLYYYYYSHTAATATIIMIMIMIIIVLCMNAVV